MCVCRVLEAKQKKAKLLLLGCFSTLGTLQVGGFLLASLFIAIQRGVPYFETHLDTHLLLGVSFVIVPVVGRFFFFLNGTSKN